MIEKEINKRYTDQYKHLLIGGDFLDRITESFLKEFTQNHEIENLNISEQFEFFSDYCAIANESSSVDVDLMDMKTGMAAQGIDGIAIDVNGKYVTDLNEIDELIRYNKNLTVTFVFVQAKTSEEFNNSLISNFLGFVQTFFGERTTVFMTEEMQHFLELKDYIFSRSANMKLRNPNVHLYYASCGAWNQSDSNLYTVVQQNVDALYTTNLFEKVEFIPLGSKELQNAYRRATNETEATFLFDKRATMFSDNDSNIAYCGVLPYTEFKKIICTENGNLKDVFEDNIRDFLGNENDVNGAIEDTIKSGDFQKFSVLNNGITIVADRVNITGDRVTISNYQIVNGCQTSHVIFMNEHNFDNDLLMIPIRLIATENEDLKNEITKATNNQTSIKKEQLEALSTFQRVLEEYYKTYSEESLVLYYERRTGQYRNKGVPQNKIVSIPMQIKAAASMFLDNPHGVSGQYGTIAKNVGKKLFRENDKPILYYVSALTVYRYETFIKQKRIEKKYRKARYHVAMLFKYVVAGKKMPKYFNSKSMESYCIKIKNVLNNEEVCLEYFLKIINFIINQESIDYDDRKIFERKETTEKLLRCTDELIQSIKQN